MIRKMPESSSNEMNQKTGKQRIFDVFDGKSTDQIPWVPFAGIHAGKLKNKSPTDLLTDDSTLVECLIEVNKQYHPDGQPITFDLQIEAEILGCELKWLEKSPPVVVSHPLSDIQKIPGKIPSKGEGRLPMFLSAMEKFKEYVGDKTALFALVTGPLTLASHLRGTKLFMDTIRDKEYVKELLEYCK